MSAIAHPSSPAVDALMDAISRLSDEEKEDLVERVRGQMEEPPVPQWHLDILAEREAMRRQGLDEPVPFEEGMRQVRERLRAQGIMVE